jgi:hypothetical protein
MKGLFVASAVVLVWAMAVAGLAYGQEWFVSDHELGIDPGADQAALQGGLFIFGVVWLFGVILMAVAAAVWRDRQSQRRS